jgi:hypothetical protein
MAEQITLDWIRNRLYTENEYKVKYQDPYVKLTEAEIIWLRKKFDINPEWHRTCVACIARQHIKYGENNIPCSGIKNSLPPGSAEIVDQMMIKDGISRERATLVLRATQDPVAWCELMFGFDDSTKDTDNEWYLRPYQKEQIRCTSRRIALREGRRSGKTFAIALKLLHAVETVKIPKGKSNGQNVYAGPQIMIVTPYQAQINAIFQEMEDLLLRCPELAAQVTTGASGSLYAKTPPLRMEFKNGGVIKGFVSGVGVKQDGSSGGTMRGQSADIIYLDEMDMIPEKILDDAIIPIMATRKNTRIIATSTPIGKRAAFYKWCMQDASFKEDHIPTTVLPQWDETKDLLTKGKSKDSIMSEFMAEFIDGGSSVFRPSWIMSALREYTYYETISNHTLRTKLGVARPEKLIKCMGIDWNKNAGTEFYVAGYDADGHRWIGLEAINISQSEFSSIKWKEEVIRLTHKWNLDYIYADDGYGHTIIEDLQVYSLAMREKEKKTEREKSAARIVDIIKSFNFSSKVTLRSPVDGREIQKTAKDFLVENAMRIFEDEKFVFPKDDEQLKNELGNYIIVRRNPQTNRPIYGPENATVGDHRLDAWMLALGGLFIELSEYSPNMYGDGNVSVVDDKTLEKRGKENESDLSGTAEFIRDVAKAGVSITGLNIYGGNGTLLNELDYEGSKKQGISRRNNAPKTVAEYYKNLPKGYDPDSDSFNDDNDIYAVPRRGGKPLGRR